METSDQEGLLTANKFKSFPVVNSTCYWLTEGYTKLRQVNFVTRSTCDIAETTLKNSIYLASPLVNKFKDQVTSLDSMACNQLEKLETAFPIIKSDTEDIVSQSKQLINKTVEPVSTRYKSLQNNTINTCNSVKSCLNAKSNAGQALANRFLDISQNFLEQYLIYADLLEFEAKNDVDEYIKYYSNYKLNEKHYQTLIKRIRVLTYVYYFSLKANLFNRAKLVHEILTKCYARLYAYLHWFDLYKNSLLKKSKDTFYLTKDKLDLYKEYLDVLSKQFTVQDGRSLHHVHSLEDRTKIIIRRSLGNLIAGFHLIHTRVSNVIPIIQFRFKILGQFISDLYHIYKKNDGSFNEMLVETILREIGECTYKTQSSVNTFLKSLNNSAIVSWFVPNFETFGVLDYEYEEYTVNQNIVNNSNKGQICESSEEELANAFSLELTYSSEFSQRTSGNSLQNHNQNNNSNNKSSFYDVSSY